MVEHPRDQPPRGRLAEPHAAAGVATREGTRAERDEVLRLATADADPPRDAARVPGAMTAHPVPIRRPLATAPRGTVPTIGPLAEEDGEVVRPRSRQADGDVG